MTTSELYSKVINGNKAAGVHCFINTDGSVVYDVVIVKAQSNNKHIVIKNKQLFSVEEVVKATQKLPILVSLDGKGILHKKTRIFEESDYIGQVFPGISINQFCIQEYRSGFGEIFLSVCRSDQLELILSDFQKSGVFIVNVLLGPFSLESIEIENGFYSGRNSITFTEGRVTGIERSNEEPQSLTFSQSVLMGDSVIAYSNAVSYFNAISNIKISGIEINSLKKNYIFEKSFRLGTAVSLLLIFVILAINFYYFNFFKKQQEELDFKLKYSSELSRKLENLGAEYQLKEQLIKKSGILDKTRVSFYLDQLLQIMPNNIKLRSINYQPIGHKVKENEEIGYETKIITILGVAESGVAVNNWLRSITSLSWVIANSLEKYSQEEFNVPGEFEIIITINP